MGFLRPFAGLLPTFGWTRHVCFTVTRASGAHRCARRADISARPGPRVVRASASAPIDFRRGDRSPVGNHTDLRKSDRPGMLMASTSGLRFPSAVHLASARLAGGVILPWALPLAGLSGTQTISQWSPCIGRARPRYRSPASGTSTRRSSLARDPSYPLMGLLDVLPITRDLCDFAELLHAIAPMCSRVTAKY
jgi:hypothetical protein